MGYPILTKEVVQEILEAPALYCSEEEKETCQRIVEGLDEEYQTLAAFTSYAFWLASTILKDDSLTDEDARIRLAMKEARRHLVGSNGDEDVANERLRSCCEFRREKHLDLFRSCYPIQIGNNEFTTVEGTPEEEEIKAKFREYIEDELLNKQSYFVRGHDKHNHAVAIKMGRQCPETDHEAFITAQIYLAERAIAATEFLSRGQQEKVVAVMDFEGYSSSNAPPMLTLKESLTILQANYPERLKTAIITEPPFWMKGIFNLIYPFMSEDTREKVQMAYGEGKHATIIALICPEQAMPFMMPEGQLQAPVDAEVFLKKVPFFCLYDADSLE